MTYLIEILGDSGWIPLREIEAENDDHARELFEDWRIERRPPAGSYRIVIVADRFEFAGEAKAA